MDSSIFIDNEDDELTYKVEVWVQKDEHELEL